VPRKGGKPCAARTQVALSFELKPEPAQVAAAQQ
jgi:hypothetical protein